MKTIDKPCILEDRPCTDCGECNQCDLDPTKPCDNCCRCIDNPDGDFAEIGIDDILLKDEDHFSGKKHKRQGLNYKFKR